MLLGLFALLAELKRLELALDLIDFLVAAALEIDKPVTRRVHAAQQFVHLQV
jgi:hypothetical protein